MFKQFEMELAGRTLRVDVGRVCAQANGAALMHYGDTVVLSTATASKEPREGIDFFPLSVEYEEKMYAAGKILGGFNLFILALGLIHGAFHYTQWLEFGIGFLCVSVFLLILYYATGDTSQ